MPKRKTKAVYDNDHEHEHDNDHGCIHGHGENCTSMLGRTVVVNVIVDVDVLVLVDGCSNDATRRILLGRTKFYAEPGYRRHSAIRIPQSAIWCRFMAVALLR